MDLSILWVILLLGCSYIVLSSYDAIERPRNLRYSPPDWDKDTK